MYRQRSGADHPHQVMARLQGVFGTAPDRERGTSDDTVCHCPLKIEARPRKVTT